MKNLTKTLALFGVFLISNFVFSQDSANHIDSANHSSLAFGEEKGGAICANGLEKLEVAWATNKSLLFVNQLHFYAPWLLEGRIFMQAEEQIEEHKPIHFFEATFDLTVREFPVHLGYTMGLDQIGKNPNTTYSGPAVTVYWSDIHKIHNLFHILRTGINYVNLSEHIQTSYFEDSTVSLGREFEYAGFFQLQPFHISHNVSIFSEGLFRMRGEENFGEFEIGIRHSKILDDLVGIGVRVGLENFSFHSISCVIRFNISNPNPKHK